MEIRSRKQGITRDRSNYPREAPKVILPMFDDLACQYFASRYNDINDTKK